MTCAAERQDSKIAPVKMREHGRASHNLEPSVQGSVVSARGYNNARSAPDAGWVTPEQEGRQVGHGQGNDR